MYLTRLKLDTRGAAVRRDLASAYDMHRTLSRAFADSADARPSPFLWRLDSSDAAQGVAVLLVQSTEQGRWASLPADYLLDTACKKPGLAALLQNDKRYRFRLLANPTVCRNGKRYGLTDEEEQLAWLQRQLHKAGCTLQSAVCTRSERWVMRKKGHLITVQAVGYEGILTIAQAEALLPAIRQGMGHAKSLGLGMLSVAPV